jgi:hypothetical protein
VARVSIGDREKIHILTMNLRSGSETFAAITATISRRKEIQHISARFADHATIERLMARVLQPPERTSERSRKSAAGKKSARAPKSPSAKSPRARSPRAKGK